MSKLGSVVDGIQVEALQIRALCADQPAPSGILRFFPNENDHLARLTAPDIEKLIEGLSPLYARLAQEGGRALGKRFPIGPGAALVLARDPMVLLTFFFFERLLRFDRFVKRFPDRPLAALASGPLKLPLNLAEFRTLASNSESFNQFALGLIAAVWDANAGNPAGKTIGEAPPIKSPVRNFNFETLSFWRRARWKAIRTLSRFFGRWPTLALGYEHSRLQDALIFSIGRLCDLRGDLPQADFSADTTLREAFIGETVSSAKDELIAWLKAADISDSRIQEKILEQYETFLRLCYPSTHLEALAAHQSFCVKKLAPFAPKPLFVSEMGDPYTAHMIAAAKDLGMPVIGVQHAAHYGYVDCPSFNELQLVHFDQYLSWGWTTPPDHPTCRKLKAIPLPAPSLSERAKAWKNLSRGRPTAKRYDVLLMTDKFQRFPPTLSTNRHFRLDYLPQYIDTLERLVLGLTGLGMNILHKPFDQISLDAVTCTVERLRNRTNDRYNVYDKLDTGLTTELLGRCSMVLWDEPGTGPFECMAGNVPTMLYWPRIASHEAARAQADFLELEDAGILHKELTTVLAEIKNFKADPERWMQLPKRKAAIAKILRRYAWVDDQWPRAWRAYLRTLPS